jgi:hypothetical protein
MSDYTTTNKAAAAAKTPTLSRAFIGVTIAAAAPLDVLEVPLAVALRVAADPDSVPTLPRSNVGDKGRVLPGGMLL